MARLFDDAADEHLKVSSPGVTDYPLTLAAWFNTNQADQTQHIFGLSEAGGGEDIRLVMVSSNKLHARTDNLGASSDDSVAQIESPTISTNTWHHACGAFTATDNFNAYLDGANKTADDNGATNAPTALDTISIGLLIASSNIQPFSGLIAECAIWNAVLTDAEVAILATGVSPLFVRPASLVHYHPLVGRHDPEIDLISGADLTLVNTPGTGAHTRVFYPRRHSKAPAAAVGDQTVTTGVASMAIVAPTTTVAIGAVTVVTGIAQIAIVAPAATLAFDQIVTTGVVAVPIVAPAPATIEITLTTAVAPMAIVAPATAVVVGGVTVTTGVALMPIVAPAPASITIGGIVTTGVAPMAIVAPATAVVTGAVTVITGVATTALVAPAATLAFDQIVITGVAVNVIVAVAPAAVNVGATVTTGVALMPIVAVAPAAVTVGGITITASVVPMPIVAPQVTPAPGGVTITVGVATMAIVALQGDAVTSQTVTTGTAVMAIIAPAASPSIFTIDLRGPTDAVTDTATSVTLEQGPTEVELV